MSVTGVSVDGNCGNLEVSFFLNDGSETALDAELFTDDRGPPTQFLINSVDDPAKAGSFSVTYKAYLVDYPSVLTYSASPVLVTVLDPCKAPTATITSPTLINQLHFLNSGSLSYAITPFTI